jgi:hypothetical protein
MHKAFPAQTYSGKTYAVEIQGSLGRILQHRIRRCCHSKGFKASRLQGFKASRLPLTFRTPPLHHKIPPIPPLPPTLKGIRGVKRGADPGRSHCKKRKVIEVLHSPPYGGNKAFPAKVCS